VDAPRDSADLVKKLGLHFPLLSDPDMRTILAYGVAMKGRDIAVPSVFVVQQDRAITYTKVGETVTDRPLADEVLAQAKAAAGKT
jgi:peroxiredoxin